MASWISDGAKENLYLIAEAWAEEARERKIEEKELTNRVAKILSADPEEVEYIPDMCLNVWATLTDDEIKRVFLKHKYETFKSLVEDFLKIERCLGIWFSGPAADFCRYRLENYWRP